METLPGGKDDYASQVDCYEGELEVRSLTDLIGLFCTSI